MSTFVAMLGANSAHAVDLVGDYQKATAYDPAYQTALAERTANHANATQSRAAYFPEGSINNQRLQTDTTNRQTISINQPLINLERIAQWRMAEPRDGLAEATFLVKQQDLATRLLKAANAIILANESIRLNTAKMATLNEQAVTAKKKFEYGQGTITDVRDVQAKAALARVQQLTFKTNLEVAIKQYAAITGERPKLADFKLAEKARPVKLGPTQEYLDAASKANANLQVARLTERIADLDIDRATGSMLPAVAATHMKSTYNGQNVNYSGVTVNVPLAPLSYYARASVKATYLKAKESTKDVEEKMRVDVERLHDQVEAGMGALVVQHDAIESAQLSLESNVKSFEGGVRTTVDILNAAQAVFQVKSDYVTLATQQAENLLSLSMQSGVDPLDALTSTTRFLGVN